MPPARPGVRTEYSGFGGKGRRGRVGTYWAVGAHARAVVSPTSFVVCGAMAAPRNSAIRGVHVNREMLYARQLHQLWLTARQLPFARSNAKRNRPAAYFDVMLCFAIERSMPVAAYPCVCGCSAMAGVEYKCIIDDRRFERVSERRWYR